MSSTYSVVITGANQGLGYHTVHQIAQQPHKLVFMGARRMPAAEAAIAQIVADGIHPTSAVVAVYLDLADEQSIADAGIAVAAALKERGLTGIDALVNNAAMADGPPALVFSTNIAGTMAVKAAFRPLLKAGGTIVNVSSALGSQGLNAARPKVPTRTLETYGASKAALNNLTLQWAYEEEESGSGVRVVALDPGLTTTTMTSTRSFLAGHGESPAVACKVMVDAALATEGKSGVFFDKNGTIPW
ncbi:unnamed protein product [Mycena citricolor]|uniref:Uncharacterized protein n=1 Tax=Mycena citricolor TaxID=2018698 RepID=A0AAD2HXA2_9AGAR|nr:unnamed protein product [Mycena citricolor]